MLPSGMHVAQKEPCHIAPKALINIANIICLCVYKDLPYRAVYGVDSMSNHLFLLHYQTAYIAWLLVNLCRNIILLAGLYYIHFVRVANGPAEQVACVHEK